MKISEKNLEKEGIGLITPDEFNKLREDYIKKTNGKHIPQYILRRLNEEDTFRQTYLALVKLNPARISEISEESILSKPTCYSQLHKLMKLGMGKRIFVADILNDDNEQSNSIKEKFKKWTDSMPDGLKRYYLAKTSYWLLTDFGKSFFQKAIMFEDKFREKIKNG